MHLILMRHGNTFEEGQTPVQIGARSDLPLTDFGRSQAERVGKYLYDEGICPSAIFAGRLKRQMESAQIVADYFDIAVFEADALNEIDYGEWEGLSAEEIKERFPKEYREWTEDRIWPSSIFGKSYEAHQKALDEFLEFLKGEHQGVILAVTSNGLLQFFKSEKVKTGNFCELHFLKNQWEIKSWNRRA